MLYVAVRKYYQSYYGGENMVFNEDTRVKIPALIHFKRLGTNIFQGRDKNIDPRNNIFVDIFTQAINKNK